MAAGAAVLRVGGEHRAAVGAGGRSRLAQAGAGLAQLTGLAADAAGAAVVHVALKVGAAYAAAKSEWVQTTPCSGQPESSVIKPRNTIGRRSFVIGRPRFLSEEPQRGERKEKEKVRWANRRPAPP